MAASKQELNRRLKGQNKFFSKPKLQSKQLAGTGLSQATVALNQEAAFIKQLLDKSICSL